MSNELITPPPTGTTRKQHQQPSLYARKLLQKLSTLQSNASLESRQTIASWMVFNRKKVEGMGEGLLLAIYNAEGISSANAEAPAARLMLLLRIIHQVLLSNSPLAVVAAAGAIEGGSDAGANDKWEKSSPLRLRLGEMAIPSLWKALASSLQKMNETTRDQCQNEIKAMVDEWKEHNVFGGPTIWEEYRRGWARALKEGTAVDHEVVLKGDEGSMEKSSSSHADDFAQDATETTAQTTEEVDGAKIQARDQAADSERASNDINCQNDGIERDNADATLSNNVLEKKEGTMDGPESNVVNDRCSCEVREEGVKVAATATAAGGILTTKKNSIACVDIEADFEGIEQAKVEPSQFLDACQVIASIQITRDLGSDAAMNLSSALSKIPPEVEKACNTILTQQKDGQEESKILSISDLVSADVLSSLPDEVLALDLTYARQSLQSYREAIRQQRKARLQCLQLLLASRCSFGSMEAARAFCSGGNGEGREGNGSDGITIDMDTVLEKLKKRKEILVDAMALEGLDVEEKEEEKIMERDHEAMKPLSWFPGQEPKQEQVAQESHEGKPSAKKLKSS